MTNFDYIHRMNTREDERHQEFYESRRRIDREKVIHVKELNSGSVILNQIHGLQQELEQTTYPKRRKKVNQRLDVFRELYPEEFI